MAHTLQHETPTLSSWLQAASADHRRAQTHPPRRGRKHAIVSHCARFKISVRSAVLRSKPSKIVPNCDLSPALLVFLLMRCYPHVTPKVPNAYAIFDLHVEIATRLSLTVEFFMIFLVFDQRLHFERVPSLERWRRRNRIDRYLAAWPSTPSAPAGPLKPCDASAL